MTRMTFYNSHWAVFFLPFVPLQIVSYIKFQLMRFIYKLEMSGRVFPINYADENHAIIVQWGFCLFFLLSDNQIQVLEA